MVVNHINFPELRIGELCRRFGVKSLSLFGSILGDHFTSDSDVDMLVEFIPQSRIGLIGIANLQAELSQLIGRNVDLRTPAELSRYFRNEVLAHAKLLHAA
ncbi:MAG TPA: nucleotidyltransferase domain-containing protein [Phycisphaerales bacterium]|nr:nucleotidyltransferase domain-containing protein [Phycisphaerales bacterium]